MSSKPEAAIVVIERVVIQLQGRVLEGSDTACVPDSTAYTHSHHCHVIAYHMQLPQLLGWQQHLNTIQCGAVTAFNLVQRQIIALSTVDTLIHYTL